MIASENVGIEGGFGEVFHQTWDIGTRRVGGERVYAGCKYIDEVDFSRLRWQEALQGRICRRKAHFRSRSELGGLLGIHLPRGYHARAFDP